MGKPSSTRLSKGHSQATLTTSSSSILNTNNQEMGKRNKKKNSKHKIHKHMEKKRCQRQTQNKIDKLKKVLSETQCQSSTKLDSSYLETILVQDNTLQNGTKRKLSDNNITESNKCIKIDNYEPVIIPDDDVLIINHEQCNSLTPRKNLNTAPIDCSTPIMKPKDDLSINSISENFNADVINLTKEINRDSYLTIDLTNETTNKSNSKLNTVIDLDNTDTQECTVISVSNASLSLSGESDVTVLHNRNRKTKSGLNNLSAFVNGIAKMNASEKGKLLELITQKVFSGCKAPQKIKSHLSIIKETANQSTETVEDRYIKEVILGEKQSRNSIGSNIYNPERDRKLQTGLRMIVIDGSNVAMDHSKGKQFSVKGLKICIDYFLKRGHVVKAFVPRFRCKFGKSTEPRLLDELERQGHVIYTPSREVQGRMITSYDDRYIVQCAAEFDGVIVSGDNYRDLLQENPRWRFIIENRLLQFTWVNDMIMFPRDPLGRFGPTLEQFLRYPTRDPSSSSTATS